MLEALYLSPIDWNMADFKTDGKDQLPNFSELHQRSKFHILPIQLLIAGFDGGEGTGVFSVGVWR